MAHITPPEQQTVWCRPVIYHPPRRRASLPTGSFWFCWWEIMMVEIKPRVLSILSWLCRTGSHPKNTRLFESHPNITTSHSTRSKGRSRLSSGHKPRLPKILTCLKPACGQLRVTVCSKLALESKANDSLFVVHSRAALGVRLWHVSISLSLTRRLISKVLSHRAITCLQ